MKAEAKERIINLSNIILLDRQTEQSYSPDEVLQKLGWYSGPLVATDFDIIATQGWSKDQIISGNRLVGYRFTNIHGQTIDSIDHHYPDPTFREQISSTNLSILYMQGQQQPGLRRPVLISHTDTDSIASAMILSGKVGSEHWEMLGEAAIAADHTGEENLIADVLQSVDNHMVLAEKGMNTSDEITQKSLAVQMYLIEMLLTGKELPDFAKDALEKRRAQRRQAKKFYELAMQHPKHVAQIGDTYGRVNHHGNGVVHFEILGGEKFPTEFLPAVVPNSSVVIETSNRAGIGTHVDTSLRIGSRFPHGGTLHDLRLADFNIRGRWNGAGSRRDKLGTRKADIPELIRRAMEYGTPM